MEILGFLINFFWGIGYAQFCSVPTQIIYCFYFYKKKSYSSFVDILSENNNAQENNVLSKALFNLMFYAFCVVVFLFVVDIYLVNNHEGVAGIFGDFFGGVLNPILTFLTFLGLIVTIVVQRHELRLSRVEYEKTAEALTTQSVENTFFNTLELHHKITDNIKFDLSALDGGAYLDKLSGVKKFLKLTGASYDAKYSDVIVNDESASAIAAINMFEGRAAFDGVLKYLAKGAASPKQVLERYGVIQDEYNHVFGHYFRNLYQVLKLIDRYEESIVSESSKKKYASILRAQLSTKELALLFVNCLDGVCDKGKFKNLLIKYKMFEHLPIKLAGGSKSRFIIGGGAGIVVDRSMVLQYKKEKEFPMLDLVKVYGGAFGENRSVPYNLARKDYLSQETQ
ncbi:putative phage abortive infection protein [Pseudomonas moraviensis]|uniref:putative phage abortive infection protein n=1 Tax=Pseudomonas moraviensis TaxID=321662 RepID=UPI002B310A58|nr:putative phage abortive infection protein [Pseudomonas moraviensis]